MLIIEFFIYVYIKFVFFGMEVFIEILFCIVFVYYFNGIFDGVGFYSVVVCDLSYDIVIGNFVLLDFFVFVFVNDV